MLLATGLALLAGVATAAGGIKYTFAVGPLPQGGAELLAKCPAGTKVVGGGVTDSFGDSGGPTFVDIEVGSTYPINESGSRPDEWYGRMNNKDSTGQQMSVHAICVKHGTVTYRERSKTLPDDSQAQRVAACPPRTKVTGGGVVLLDTDLDTEVAASFPVDLGGKDKRPDDGWRGRATNTSGQDTSMSVFAVCARSGHYRYVKASRPVPDGTRQKRTVECPSGRKVVGGGVSTSNADNDIELAGSISVDGDDTNNEFDDAWFGAVNNDGSGNLTNLTTWVVCKRV